MSHFFINLNSTIISDRKAISSELLSYSLFASLGGDSFGCHWLDEDTFAIYLVDVSGHGVGAALLSVSVMNALRSQSLPDINFNNPEQVLASLNVAFPSEENNDMFFTIWYGVYNKSTRELTYASVGHPPALFLDKSHAGQFNLNSHDNFTHLLIGLHKTMGLDDFFQGECPSDDRF
jgi:serine phosphatase RsbU (regulator of sigma subunit)